LGHGGHSTRAKAHGGCGGGSPTALPVLQWSKPGWAGARRARMAGGDGGCGATSDNLRRDETIVRSPVVAKWSPCCEHPVIKRVWWGGDGDQKKAQVVCEFARPRATSRRVWCEEGGCGSNVEACLEGLRGSLPTVIEFKRCAPIKCAHAWVRGCKKTVRVK
jgi:hypothetical protein